MKKIVLALLAAAAFVFASCGNSADTAGVGAGLASGGTGGTGATGGGILPDGTVTINTSKMVYIGEGPEAVDGVTYNVKKYAQLVIDDNPYFYTYYKLYFLNSKLRRVHYYDHGIGHAMDCKYTDFVEHLCGSASSNVEKPVMYTYYENGALESYIQPMVSGGCAEQHYYATGKNKLQAIKATNVDGTVSSLQFAFCYPSGYMQYYCTYNSSLSSNNFLYSYADGKQMGNGVSPYGSTDPSVYATKEACTLEQAEAKLAQLKRM